MTRASILDEELWGQSDLLALGPTSYELEIQSASQAPISAVEDAAANPRFGIPFSDCSTWILKMPTQLVFCVSVRGSAWKTYHAVAVFRELISVSPCFDQNGERFFAGFAKRTLLEAAASLKRAHRRTCELIDKQRLALPSGRYFIRGAATSFVPHAVNSQLCRAVEPVGEGRVK